MRTVILFLFFVAIVNSPTFAATGKRVALVVGNAQYEHAGVLANPTNDADAVAKKLTLLGFDVTLGIDLDQPTFRQKVRAFSSKAQDADIAVLFYAGHGIQADGENYLIPVDADIVIPADLRWNTISLQNVLREMEGPGRTTVIILDACRNNPLARKLRSITHQNRSMSVGRGLARMVARQGSFLAFATSPDDVASDGEGKHSPFTRAFLKHIEEPGLDIARLMRRVRRDVHSATNGEQTPWSNSSLLSDFAFREEDETDSPSKKSSASSQELNSPTSLTQQAEILFWNSINNSDDPQVINTYLARYPKGIFSGLAKVLIEKLEKKRQTSDEAEKKAKELAAAERAEYLAAAEKQAAELKVKQASQAAEAEQARAQLKAALEAQKIAERESEELLQELKRARMKVQIANAEKNALVSQSVEVAALNEHGPQITKGESIGEAKSKENKDNAQEPGELAREMQSELKRVGCYSARVDGDWGARSAAALANFAKYSDSKLASAAPSSEWLEALRSAPSRICPNNTSKPPKAKTRSDSNRAQKNEVIKKSSKESKRIAKKERCRSETLQECRDRLCLGAACSKIRGSQLCLDTSVRKRNCN